MLDLMANCHPNAEEPKPTRQHGRQHGRDHRADEWGGDGNWAPAGSRERGEQRQDSQEDSER